MAPCTHAIVVAPETYVIAPHGERGSALSASVSGKVATGRRQWSWFRPRHASASFRSGAAAAVLCCTATLTGLGGFVDSVAASARPRIPHPAVATLTRTASLSESGRLRLTSKKGFTLNERGTVSGTIAGTIYIHLHLVSMSKVTAEVNIYPRNGSLTGGGSASYHVEGRYAVFSGKLAITRGSGKYARARASGLRFTGTIQRRDDSVSVRLSGPLSY